MLGNDIVNMVVPVVVVRADVIVYVAFEVKDLFVVKVLKVVVGTSVVVCVIVVGVNDTVSVLIVVVRCNKVVCVAVDCPCMVVGGVIVVVVNADAVVWLTFVAGVVIFVATVGVNLVFLKVVVRFDKAGYVVVN